MWRRPWVWTFEYPAALFLLLLVPALVYLRHFRGRRGGALYFAYEVWASDDAPFHPGFHPGVTWGRVAYVVSAVLFWAGFGLLCVSAAGPATVEQERVFLSRGTDIVFVLDESPSMSAQDFEPTNRFEAAKDVIRSFVAGRSNDHIGLVGFGSDTLLRIPPTLDYDSLLEVLGPLSVMELGEGTAIGMGISVAALHLSAGKSPNRVIVLLTDGENNAGEIQPQTAAEIARQLDIRIYCIGIGEEGETTLSFIDPTTGRETTGTYIGRFDEELLRTIAAASGGTYFHAASPGTLRTIFREIDALESTEKRVRIYTRREQRFGLFLMIALALIGCDFMLRHLVVREVI